ncbi:MAG: NUDIX hydrolase [Microlunatus sp.]|nr:NUDIX hydrolase [Microlunatus sp.]
MAVSSRAVLARLDRSVPDLVIRSMESLGSGPPAPARPACSVVLLRDHRSRLETYALHRHAKMPFAPGMVVFPGGGLDPADGVPAADHDLRSPALLACAVRETAEETGVHLGADDLHPWAHWITPEAEPRRYDTFFYLAGLPAGQDAADVSGETSAAQWRTAADLLAAADAGEIAMLPPTRSIVIELTAYATVQDALAATADRVVETVLPRAVKGPAGWTFEYGPDPGGADAVRL